MISAERKTILSLLHMNIPTTLDLNQAIETFKQTIAPLLVVAEISSWDGVALKAREEEIRAASLVLAGQVNALVLHELSPLVWSVVAGAGMQSSSFAQATEQLQQWGIELNEKQVARLTYGFGQIGLQLTEQWMAQLQQGQLPTGSTFEGQRVGLSLDGGRTRLRYNKQGRRKANKRRGYRGH